MRIALLEDEPAQAEVLLVWLQAAGHDAHHYARGKAFLDAVNHDTFDLLIIDWNVPDISGPDVLTRVREHVEWQIPVLFVTSRDREQDIVFALEHGADDYMAKPVKRQEVLARIGALERRALPPETRQERLEIAPYTIDVQRHEIAKHGEPIELTNREFELALLLFRNRGRLLSRGYILESVWGTRADLNTRTVDTHVSRIRSKLGINPADGWRLSAVYQHGYRLETLEQPAT